jgi:UDP-2-acetamido-3-amino-2,3-dideoxy-glucuronate N-acetyltransferase
MSRTPYFVHPSAILDAGCEVGLGTKIWHFSHLMPGARVGAACNIGQNVFIADGVQVGNRVKIQNNVSLYTGLVVADDVFLGPSCVFTNVINPRSGVNRKDAYLPTHIGRGATIGANATVICGNHIGEYAFIAAGSVVTKAVPAYALVMGNPARQRGWMSAQGHKLAFDEQGLAQCPDSGSWYQLKAGKVSPL